MTRTIPVKMAKASDDDIRRVNRFFQMVEEFITYGTRTDDADDVKAIDDGEFVELIRMHWNQRGPGVGSSWSRVVWGCDTLIQNCCDPSLDHLEWRPDVLAFLEEKRKAELTTEGTEITEGEAAETTDKNHASVAVQVNDILVASRCGADAQAMAWELGLYPLSESDQVLIRELMSVETLDRLRSLIGGFDGD